MEFLILILIGFLIAIVVLPSIALAKANSAKRGLDDLVKRLSSLEKELRNLQAQSVSSVKTEAPATAPAPIMQSVAPLFQVETTAQRIAVFVRAQFDSGGASGRDRVRRRCKPCGWGFASKTARKRRHYTDALRNRRSGAVCGDVCLPSLLSLRVVWFRPNVFVDDADHGGCFCACRPIERDRRGGAWDCGWFSHARLAFKGRR